MHGTRDTLRVRRRWRAAGHNRGSEREQIVLFATRNVHPARCQVRVIGAQPPAHHRIHDTDTMLGGLADYGSDSGSDSEPEQRAAAPAPTKPTTKPTAEPPRKKRKGPIKIGLDLPAPSAAPDDEDRGPLPVPKKAAGAGS